ncbi:MAG: GNAT family N-acetyltransferase [Rhizobiales bacterium]|nr:GNAT family N-acetyltransferase [Hyphomicrobiales bacterium]MBA70024.1 GNAT family N-acetyltransferase [Hyphomicrobiales bacterium]
MHSDPVEYTLRTTAAITDIPPTEWEQLAGANRLNSSTNAYNPFVSHAYLSSLEESGTVSADTGWMPRHLVLEDDTGRLLGAMPSYIKSHSMGEYVFDHAWADAYERAGGHYYPKLQSSIPFTPATGPRLMARTGIDGDPVRHALAGGARTLTERLGLSSAHATFVPEDELAAFEEEGFLHRTDQQFHFTNQGYGAYDDFLDTLASRKRKNLRKERRTATENGIDIEWLTGTDLSETVWDTFFGFYMDTAGRKWGRPYLNRRFFSLIGERMADDILLVMAKREGRYIAGAINFIGSDTLYGRHWGCVEDHPFLHFEVCYHQAIDFAIDRKLTTVEAGAQGEHKLARGYLPVTTHSAHFIAHPGLRDAVANYLEHERRDVEVVSEALTRHGPFRKTDASD